MKLVIRTLFFHFLCIIIFSFVYFLLSEHFYISYKDENAKHKKYLDFFLLSVTTQSGVGMSDLYPISTYSKIAMIVQQFFMILTHVMTIYVFTI
jgi:hypothetical protein